MAVVGIAVAWALLMPLEAAEYRHSPSAQVLGPYPIDDGRVFRTYCITCHNKRLRTAGLELDALDLSDVRKNPELWEKVARKLRAGAMPPAGRPRPTSEVVGAFVSSIEAQLDRAAAAHPNLGRTEVFHRLNRTEYHNAIRDLLDIDLDVSTILAADDANFGFDNIADLLTISPALLDRYLSAARKLSPAAVGLSPSGPEMEIHRISDGLRQDGYVSEDLPFGSRGGAAVRHRFPSDGE